MTSAAARVDDGVMAEINITPFTDVLLVLIIIFMILAAIATPPGFQKELLGHIRSTPATIEPNKVIDVIVTRGGEIYIDDVATTDNGLSAAIANAVEAHKAAHLSTHIAIVADADAKYDTIIRILDAGRQAGDDDVGFVTR
ncbi:MAG TPA: biopolymer transporter ExbD [Candidatus Eremiobacteraceae bacterium]|nr:biopolymer transporter ExbD [Candidatus Eremiobacteraceae bacterium]